MGDYTVEGIYEGVIRKQTVIIEPDEHEKLFLELPAIIKHDTPPKVSIGETITLTLDLISAARPTGLKFATDSYSRKGDELEQGNKEMRLWKGAFCIVNADLSGGIVTTKGLRND